MAAAPTPSESLFISDLPPTMDEATLVKVFGSYGTIKSTKLFPVSNRGQGNAIVTFQSIDEAKWLVENLSGNIPQGLDTAVTVNYKTENWKKAAGMAGGGKGGWGAMAGGMDSWGQGGWSQGGGGGGWGQGGGGAAAGGGWGQGGGGGGKGGVDAATPGETLFLGDLPTDMTDEKLKAVFGEYGTVVSHKMLPPSNNGKLAAIISFDSVEGAKWIVENLNGNIPQGLTEPITVKYKTPNKKFQQAAWGAPPKDESWTPPAAWAGAAKATTDGGSWGAAPAGPAQRVDPSQAIFVGDLPHGTDEATVTTVFGAYATVVSVKILAPNQAGVACIVNLSSAEEAKWCAENMNDQIPQGLTTPIKCRLKDTQNKGAAGKGWGGGGKGWGPY